MSAFDTVAQPWRGALDDFIESRMTTPFQWGVNDCCLFAADAVLAMTGVDYAAGLRGTYSTAADAMALVDQLGGMEVIGARAGERIGALSAVAGDVGLIPLDDRSCLAICTGDAWVMPTTDGLGAQPFEAAAVAWRVTHG